MKSLKDEIDECSDNFIRPVSQAFRNIRDSITDGISDAVADCAEGNKPRKKGCLWSVMKWFLILVLLSGLLSECQSEKAVSTDNSSLSSSQTTATEKDIETKPVSINTEPVVTISNDIPDNIYELVIAASRDNIEDILKEVPTDMDKLQEEYEFLLSLKISEYMFKASCYGYYTEEYQKEFYSDVRDEAAAICEEMKNYFPEDEVDDYYTEFSILSYQAFDERYFNYDSVLIGSKANPDVDAMWITYVEAMVAEAGPDFQDLMNMYNTALYFSSRPTESSEEPEPEETQGSKIAAPIQQSPTSETCIEGYVMYGIGGLNIRSGPGVAYEQVGRLPEGERVVISETQYSGTAEWGRIERGWVCMDYIQIGNLADTDQYYGDFMVGQYWNLEDSKHFWIYTNVETDGTITFWLEYPLGDDNQNAGIIAVPSTEYIPGNHGHTITFHVGDYYPEYYGDIEISGYFESYGIEYTISANVPGVFDTGGEPVTTIGPMSDWGDD